MSSIPAGLHEPETRLARVVRFASPGDFVLRVGADPTFAAM